MRTEQPIQDNVELARADNSNSFIDWSVLNHYGVNDQGATVYKMLGVLHAKVGDGIGGVKDVQLDIQYGFALPE